MAKRETAPGLSIGQLVTLTFGFLLASALIFAFGFWVGYDAAQRRLARDQQFVRLPVAPAPTKAAVLTPAEVAGNGHGGAHDSANGHGSANGQVAGDSAEVSGPA